MIVAGFNQVKGKKDRADKATLSAWRPGKDSPSYGFRVQHKDSPWLSATVRPVKFLGVSLFPIFFYVHALDGPPQAGCC